MRLLLLILTLISFFGVSSFAEEPYLECRTLMADGYSEEFVVGYENNLFTSDQLAIGPGFPIDQRKLSRSEYRSVTGLGFRDLVLGFTEFHSNSRVDTSHVFTNHYDREKMFGEEASYLRLENRRSQLRNPSLRPDFLYISESLLNEDSGRGYLIVLTDSAALGWIPMLLSSCERI